MLSLLTIQNVRLIEKLELAFSQGLSVLSGETGAGKSILLEALGLALGERAETGLIRKGSSQACVTAAFMLPHHHDIWTHLKEQGLEVDAQDALVLRRLISLEGPLSRAFINDQNVSVTFLRKIAEKLVDIHGQLDHFLVGTRQTTLIDQYGKLQDIQKSVSAAYILWQEQKKALEDIQIHQKRAQEHYAFIQYSFQELQELAPQENEEKTLLEQRSRLSHQEKFRENLSGAETCLSGPQGVSAILAQANRFLERASPFCGLQSALIQETVNRLFAELEELERLLKSVFQESDSSSISLEALDDRLFQLKAIARKHNISPQELPQLQETFQRQLDLCEQSEENQKKWEEMMHVSREDYLQKASHLHQKRLEVAKRLETRIAEELPALKLDKARFLVQEISLKEDAWGMNGTHSLEFHVSTNPGELPGPLHRVASGGELSRFLLALKVSMAGCSSVSTLIFDEIDSGTGGAVAEAIGLRLRTLSAHLQVLAITHSPQVTAQSDHHWKVSKEATSKGHLTQVAILDHSQHLEEIARMLSGATITEEARAAAFQLKQAS